ncbi:MAG: PRC-barrel domain-containing protein [Candidatus Heimdallarchaeota archaeon]
MSTNYSELVSKTVVDRNGKKLGKIIRIDSITEIGKKQETSYAIIHIQRFLRKDCQFPLPLISPDQIVNQDQDVLLDITKENFSQMIKRYEIERKIKAKNAKLSKVSEKDAATAIALWARW